MNVNCAERVPADVGLNVIGISEEPAGTMVIGRTGATMAKSAGFIPVTWIAVMTRFWLPVLLTFRLSGALIVLTCCFSKVTENGENQIDGPLATPVPDSVTICGLPDASSVILKLAALVPIALGVKVTFTLKLAPG